ncbi:MAG TPA: signal peptidase II [Gammaproteobacteria bacterium]|nr:signal peptidase II [Gammaproteobacteria bacterium]|tara:strand:- start:8581 stop:9111 length:531 start_codon:yes stop_codon:yes gene_type:complete
MVDTSANSANSDAAHPGPFFIAAIFVFAADQLTKWWIVGHFYLGERLQVTEFFAWVRWHNEGAAFSFLADAGGWQRWFFVVLGIAVCAYLIVEVVRLHKDQRPMGWIYALILGGALGNLYDRAVDGYVVDFILVHYQTYIFPAFNIADSALCCGVGLWIYIIFRHPQWLNDYPSSK